MNVFQIVVTAVLTTLTVIVLSIAGAWALWPTTAQASVSVAAHASGWHNPDDGHCARFDSAHIELGEAIVSTALDLDDDQQAALEPIAQAAQRWREVAQATCESADFTNLDTSLETMETVLTQSSAAMQEVRPLISNFYATLDAAQQAKLESFIHSHGRRHGGTRRHGWHR